MQLQQLAYFVAVAERRHFTKAAQGLHVAQPSVSKQIQRLEAELGSPLFHRTKGNVALTAAGDALLPWARRVLGDVEGARNELRELAGLQRGVLSVGATPSLTTILLPPALARFHASYPGVRLALHEAGSQDLVRRLEEGALDLALVILPLDHPALETSPLLREELVVVVPEGHRLSGRARIALTDLRDVPLVMFREGYDLRTVTLAACRAAGFEPTVALDGAEMDGVLRFVAGGLGAAVVPRMVVGREKELRAISIRPALSRSIGFANRRDRGLSLAGNAFVSIVRALTPDA